MIENYQRRVHEFIKKTREKQLSKEKEFSAILQKSLKEPCLGDESMRKVHKRQKERREEAVEGNRMLEVVAHPYSWQPGWEPLQLRPRDKSQEVVAPFRQKPRGSIERIYDQTLDKGINNNIDESKLVDKKFIRKLKGYKKNPAEVMKEKGQANKILDPKKIMGELHDKTHFKTAF